MKSYAPLKFMKVATILIGGGVIVASILGLMSPQPYGQETENWRLQAQGQDIGNLMAVVVASISMWMIGKGSKFARYVWQGSMYYFIYSYLVYALAVHFNQLFLVYVAILGLSVYALIFSYLAKFDRPPETDIATRRFAGWVLIGTGVMFGFLWLSELMPALVSGELPKSVQEAGLWVNPIHVIDLSVVLPGLIMAGVLQLKRKEWGQRLSVPWLVFSVLMGSSIVAALILMSLSGYAGTIPPLTVVGAVVVLSFLAVYFTVYRKK